MLLLLMAALAGVLRLMRALLERVAPLLPLRLLLPLCHLLLLLHKLRLPQHPSNKLQPAASGWTARAVVVDRPDDEGENDEAADYDDGHDAEAVVVAPRHGRAAVVVIHFAWSEGGRRCRGQT